MHKDLLETYFKSAKEMLCEGGEVHGWCSLQHMDVEKLACNAGLHLKEKVEFRQSEDSGYHNKRGRGINAFVAAITYSSKGLSLFSLPSSPWAWTTSIGTSSSSVSISSTSSPWRNPRTALYPTFTSEKMNRAVNNLVKDLNAESVLRRGKERDEKLERTEAGLARARALIRDATIDQSSSSSRQDPDYIPRGDIYRNAYVFHRFRGATWASLLALGSSHAPMPTTSKPRAILLRSSTRPSSTTKRKSNKLPTLS
ncbi:hypothetical protein RJ640_011866 [Escallonia rubra]|uniref:25S rRNA (uridine-N(3))-methyltransferase BMT5-like domain-containing protein n=1 Tax=Escallonia rubra TaxID=112253 RepID=A0AA88ULX0_9ASTE|nr:hypothetical protein RJ640_011866 [Escallonia rubra]